MVKPLALTLGEPAGIGPDIAIAAWLRRSELKLPAFYLTGEFLELEPSRRIVHVERMHLPQATPDNCIETLFEPDGAGTLMTMRMTLPDLETRTRMLSTGMEHGMEASYVRLDGILSARR